MNTASIYERKSGYVIHPNHRLTTGAYMGGMPVWTLPPECPDSELGATIRKALAEARSGLPSPTNWNDALKPFLEACGARSWAQLAQNARLTYIETIENGIRLTPTRNAGSRGPERGFHELLESATTINKHADDATLGRAARDALGTSR